MDKARNDLSAAVPKFCLALEEHRRTPEGRVRTSQELMATFFPHDEKGCTDRLFKHLPNEVRGPIIAAWGIRGIKAALRDNDEKIQEVVHDALVAGDIDHGAFEDGLAPETLVRWVPLADLWAFWRGGKVTKQALHKALSTAYDLYLFDARWFLDTIQAKGGSIKGTDVLSEGLAKEDLAAWVRRIHETGDGTPKGIVAALGWDKIVAKTANDVLIAVLDAMVAKVGLVVAAPKDSSPLVDGLPKADAKPEAAPAAATASAMANGSERPPADGSWSTPPAAPAVQAEDAEDMTGPQPGLPMAGEIQVMLDEELVKAPPAAAAAGAAVAAPSRPVPPARAPADSASDLKQVSRPPLRPGGLPPRR